MHQNIRDIRQTGALGTAPTVSPALTSYGKTENSFLKVKGMLELVRRSHIRVNINGLSIDDNVQELNQLHFAVEISNLDRLHQMLGIPVRTISRVETDYNLMESLSMRNKESVAQTAITLVATALGAEDTSRSPPGTFHHAMNMCDENGRVCTAVYPLSAKPDLQKSTGHVQVELKCTPGPGTFEGVLVRNDFEVIYQSIDRIYTTRNTTAYMCRAVCFAATGRAAWAIVYTQGTDGSTETVDIDRIRHCDIFALLNGLRDFPWSHYWKTDANMIRATIASLGYDPDRCCVRLLGQSVNNVYAISFPRKRRHMGSNATAIGVCASEPDCCIKVCSDANKYRREVEALAATANTYASHNDGAFYALGAVSVADDTLVYAVCNDATESYDQRMRSFLVDNPDRLFKRWTTSEIAMDTENTLLPTTDTIGDFCGCIVMRVGEIPNTHNTTLHECISGLLYSLEKIHESGYLHTDIRPGNYLKFGSYGVQAIDLDNSVEMCANIPGRALVTILQGSAQYQYVGARIRAVFEKQAEHIEVMTYWSTADDIEMALVALLSD